MSEKSEDKAEGCGESTFYHTAKKICRKVMFYLIIYFNDQKRDMTSSVM